MTDTLSPITIAVLAQLVKRNPVSFEVWGFESSCPCCDNRLAIAPDPDMDLPALGCASGCEYPAVAEALGMFAEFWKAATDVSFRRLMSTPPTSAEIDADMERIGRWADARLAALEHDQKVKL
ncbi:hypothetical protein LCGC14_2297140 [marine sediment metagenome]|uniref:Uncharacterized protein n=1 Tax=marine sediment metagenome TaxID=412755 RepID=A0A0F9CQ41_9ZZZZ